MNESIQKKRLGVFHLGRYGEIISILVRYGFGDILSHLNLEKYSLITSRVIFKKWSLNETKKLSRSERIRLAIEELGPTFVKLGQFMSNRPDLIPPDLIIELEKLQDSVKISPYKDILSVIEKELKSPVNKLFAEFSEIPVASASIAQVYKAILHNGTSVAVKVQRPHIRQTISADMDILFHFFSLLERRYDILRSLRITQLLEEFKRTLDKELDFTIELSHIERFRADFKNDSKVYIPEIYTELSTKRVLVTEFVDGIKISDTDKMTEYNLDSKQIIKNGVDIVLHQIFNNGFFHADPHPGNILIRKDGRICFLDFGAVGILPPTLRYHLGMILYGMVNKDPQRIVRTLTQLAKDRIKDLDLLEYDVTECVEEYSVTLMKEINISGILQRFIRIITGHQLKIVPGFYLLVKTLIALESVGKKLDPEFNMLNNLKPFVKKLIQYNPRFSNLPYDIYFTFMDIISLLKDLPFELKDTMQIIKAGDMRVQFEHRGLEPAIIRHELIINRLVFSIVLAALIVGSSVVIHSMIPPLFFGIPLIGIIGFMLAAIIGFGLLFSMIRQRKM